MRKHIKQIRKDASKVALVILVMALAINTAFALPVDQWPTILTATETPISDGTTGDLELDREPQIIRTSDGEFIVVWYINDISSPDDQYLQVKKIDATDGTTIWGPVQLGTGVTADPGKSYDIASDGAGGVFVVWDTCTLVGCAVRGTTLGQHIDSAGAEQWAALGLLLNVDAEEPRIVIDGSGGFYVAWEDPLALTVEVTRFDSAGAIHASWTPAAPVAVPSPNSVQSDPYIIAAGSDMIITYRDRTNSQMYTTKIDATGSLVAGPWTTGVGISGTDTPADLDFDTTDDNSNGLIFTWYNGTSLKAQRVSSAGATQWGAGITVRTATITGVRNLNDGTGGAYIMWSENDGSFDNIYGHHIDSNGVLDTSWGTAVAFSDTGNSENETLPTVYGRSNMVHDSTGGIIVSFDGGELKGVTNGSANVQRIDGDGNVEWGSNGISYGVISTELDKETRIASDGMEGVGVAWQGVGSRSDIFVQYPTDLTQCGVLLDNDDSGAPVISEGCVEIQINAGTLSLENIPDDFSFPTKFKSTLSQDSFSNDDPSTGTFDVDADDEDVLTVSDLRNSGNFDVTITSTAVGDGLNTIPLQNLYVATGYPTDADLTPIDSDLIGTEINEGEFASGSVNTAGFATTTHTANIDGTSQSTLVTAYTTDGVSFDANADLTPDVITLMDSDQARLTRVSQILGFYLDIPASQAAGNYAFLVTIDLIAS